ncbi:MAG TPA: DUF5666 domain-containing protein [Anaerolineae bacterium]
MDAQLEWKLIECLAALENGESLEQILLRYPEEAARLQPMLAVAASLPALRMEPSQEARLKSRKAFLAQAAALEARRGPARSRLFARPLVTFASIALAFILIGGGTLAASASALPGDPLYGVKRIVENVRLSITPDDAARATLSAQFAQERIDEIDALLAAGREAEVEFGGIIQSIQASAWLVANVPVDIDDNTRIEGSPQVGLRAQVHGRTQDGMLTAISIVVEPGEEPAPAPSPTPEPQATPRPTPTPRATETPEPTRTPTPTRTFAPTLTPTASPTPSEVEFEGTVERADAQSWTISGVTVEVNAATEFRNSPGVGHRVKVKALNIGGQLIAVSIERIDAGGGEDGNTNGNDNQNDNGNTNEDGNGNGNGNENSGGDGNETGNDSGGHGGDENNNENGNGNG